MEQQQIISATPIFSLKVVEIADDQANADGLMLMDSRVDNDTVHHAQIIPIHDDYAELWQQFMDLKAHHDELRTAVREFLGLQIGCKRAVLYTLVGLPVPGREEEAK